LKRVTLGVCCSAPEDSDVLAVSPLVRVLGYQWPVHEDEALEPVLGAAPTLLVIQRLADFSLQVEELSPLAYALLSVFGDDGARVDEALQVLSETHGVATDALRAWPACPFWASCARRACWLHCLLSEVPASGRHYPFIDRPAAGTTPPYFEVSSWLLPTFPSCTAGACSWPSPWS
jgi:hypothetical protein